MKPPGSRTTPRSSRPSIRRGPEARRPAAAGSRSTGTWATSRSATTSCARPRTPRPIARRFPKGPPLFTAASSFSGDDRQDPHFRLSKALHVADWNGHDEASVQPAPRGGRRLGVLQRRQPLDLRRLHVQGGQAVRHEVPRLLALELRGRRSVLRPGLPRRRLRLVQRLARRAAHPGDPFRAAPRGARRLPPPADARAPGQGEGRHARRPGRREADPGSPGCVQARPARPRRTVRPDDWSASAARWTTRSRRCGGRQ